MQTNTDCTLYNRLCDPLTREESWRCTVLHGVLWQDERHVSISERGLQRTDSTTVYLSHAVPEAALYVPPDTFPGESGDGWTLREGDLLMRGISTEQTPPIAARPIMGVCYNNFGSNAMRHWEVQIK